MMRMVAPVLSAGQGSLKFKLRYMPCMCIENSRRAFVRSSAAAEVLVLIAMYSKPQALPRRSCR